MRCNLRRWAASTVAAIWPSHFRRTHLPFINRREVSPRQPVILGRDTQFEGRESPTSWGLDPLANTVMGSVVLGRAVDQLLAAREVSVPDAPSFSHPDSQTFSRTNGSQSSPTSSSPSPSVQSTGSNATLIGGQFNWESSSALNFDPIEAPFDSHATIPSRSSFAQAMDIALLANSWNAAKDFASSTGGSSEPGASFLCPKVSIA